MDDETRSRVQYLRQQVRLGKEFVRNYAADTGLKGPEWLGYAPEKAGQTVVLDRIRAMEAELKGLLDGTAGEQEV